SFHSRLTGALEFVMPAPRVRLGLLALVALAPTPLRADVTPPERYAAAVQALERLIEHERADKELPAVSIALVEDQTTVWSRGFGTADPETKRPAISETVYRVGSISKLFTDL